MRRLSMRRRRESGQVLPISMISFVVLLLLNGLVFDSGMLFVARIKAQAAADAAALGGAQEIFRGAVGTAVVAAAKEDARKNGFDDEASNVIVTANNPPASGAQSGNAKFVEVVVDVEIRSFFMHLAGQNATRVRARSVAGVDQDEAPPCLLALSPDAPGAISLTGSSQLQANCKVMANSVAANSFVTEGGTCIAASDIGYVPPVGSFSACATVLPSGSTPPVSDPFGDMAEPVPGAQPLISSEKQTINAGNAASYSPLQPGYYQGGLQISGATVTLAPGLYVVDSLTVNSASVLSGTGVTIYLMPNGSLKLGGGSTLHLVAPTSGPQANVVLFGSRSNAAGSMMTVVGNADSYLEGAIYFPSSNLFYAGNSQQSAAYQMLIADTVTLAGNSQLAVNYEQTMRQPNTFRVSLVE